jgi:hypothetical protein
MINRTLQMVPTSSSFHDGFLSVLDAQRQQFAAEDDLAQSDTAVVTNLVALYKALGGGWDAVPTWGFAPRWRTKQYRCA